MQVFQDLEIGTAGVKVDKSDEVSVPEASRRRSRLDVESVLLVVNGVVAAIGGTYASTHSVAVTVAAGCAGVTAAALVVRRKN
jgi:hypothetical protein